ncbi:MAG: hypothetical protein ACRDNY_04445 [Gaiellaceae bacterium]
MVSRTETIPALPVRNVSKDGVDDTDFGTRELATRDQDWSAVTFFQRRSA